MSAPTEATTCRDRARRQAHGDAWADAVAALAATAPRRLTPEQARLVKTGLRLAPPAPAAKAVAR